MEGGLLDIRCGPVKDAGLGSSLAPAHLIHPSVLERRTVVYGKTLILGYRVRMEGTPLT